MSGWKKGNPTETSGSGFDPRLEDRCVNAAKAFEGLNSNEIVYVLRGIWKRAKAKTETAELFQAFREIMEEVRAPVERTFVMQLHEVCQKHKTVEGPLYNTKSSAEGGHAAFVTVVVFKNGEFHQLSSGTQFAQDERASRELAAHRLLQELVVFLNG